MKKLNLKIGYTDFFKIIFIVSACISFPKYAYSKSGNLIYNNLPDDTLNQKIINNSVIYFTPGKSYIINNEILIKKKNNLTIVLGTGAELIAGRSLNNRPIISIVGGSSNINITGNGTINLNREASIAIQIQDSCSNININGITFKGPNIYGVNYDFIKALGYDDLSNSKLYLSEVEINNCIFSNITGCAISFRNVKNSRIINNFIGDIYVSNQSNKLISGSGIAEMFSNNILIENNTITNCGLHGIYAGLGSNNKINDNFINNVKQGGIRLDTEHKFKISGNNISGCNNGIISEVDENGIIDENIIDSASHNGIELMSRESKKEIIDFSNLDNFNHPNMTKIQPYIYKNVMWGQITVDANSDSNIIFYYNFPIEQDWTTKTNAQSEIDLGFCALNVSIPSNSIWLVVSSYNNLKNPSTVLPFPYLRKGKEYTELKFSKDNWYTDFSKVKSIGLIYTKKLGALSFIMSDIFTNIPHNTGIIISNNQIKKCGYYGISFDSFNENIICHDNIIYDSGYFSPTSIGGYGIWITNGNKNLMIHDNYIKSSFAPAASRDIAIKTDATNMANYRLMVYNNYYNNILNKSLIDNNISYGIKTFSNSNVNKDTLLIKGLTKMDNIIVGWLKGSNLNSILLPIIKNDTLIVETNQKVEGRPTWWYSQLH